MSAAYIAASFGFGGDMNLRFMLCPFYATRNQILSSTMKESVINK